MEGHQQHIVQLTPGVVIPLDDHNINTNQCSASDLKGLQADAIGNRIQETSQGLPAFSAKLVCVSLDNTLAVSIYNAYFNCENSEHGPALGHL